MTTTITPDALEEVASALTEIATGLNTSSTYPGGTLADMTMAAAQDIASTIRFHGACVLAAAVTANAPYELREDRTEYAGDALFEIMQQFQRPSISGEYKAACGI